MNTLYVLERSPAAPSADREYDVRERIMRDGPRALADKELVMAMLGSGCSGKSVARLASEVAGIIDGANPDAKVETLLRLTGMGEAKACSVAAALELGRRYYAIKDRRIAMPSDVYPLISHFADRKQEHFLCLSLNGAHEVIALRKITSGLVNRTVIHPREIFADPIMDRACAIVVAHNHPSGNLEPSREDVEITGKLREAGEKLGIPLLDHLVFGPAGFYSFVEHGLIAPFVPA